VTDPLFKRFADSALQVPDDYYGVSNFISTRAVATYGDASHPVAFRLGNGGAGHTGILRLLCECFITSRGGGISIEWVSSHSRHSQIALLGDIVQVALTYEPAYEDLSVSEGWAQKMAKVFNDHFILVGPKSNPAGVFVDGKIQDADGSATFYKELALFDLANIDLATTRLWRLTKPATPYEALVKADREGVYIITDRATYLTAKRDKVLANAIPLIEGGHELLNPCSALVNIKAPYNARAREFASWLGSDEVQKIIGRYGQKWSVATPIFSVAGQDDMIKADRLVAKL
jgi:ABC-type tungstate transport system permease subunit